MMNKALRGFDSRDLKQKRSPCGRLLCLPVLCFYGVGTKVFAFFFTRIKQKIISEDVTVSIRISLLNGTSQLSLASHFLYEYHHMYFVIFAIIKH